MDIIANWPAEDRADLFQEVAVQRALSFAAVEKDFWVCWVLKHLFDLELLRDQILFKGGTSLSKAYGLIQRFSEDIDLTLDRSLFGFDHSLDQLQSMSAGQRKKSIEELSSKCAEFVSNDLRTKIEEKFTAVLGPSSESTWRTTLEIASDGSRELHFHYPSAPETAQIYPYIVRSVKMEIGARSEQAPAQWTAIRSYAAEAQPQLFELPEFRAFVMTAERTFWEKVTLLHGEHHRPADKQQPSRLSRHYYDVFQMVNSPVGTAAIEQIDLLHQVVLHKQIYFPSSWQRMKEASIGNLRVQPAENQVAALREDYRIMAQMFFVDPAPFDDILKTLATLEATVNKVVSAS